MSSDPASSPGRPARRSLLKVIGGGAAGMAAVPLLSACATGAASGPAAPSLQAAPPQQAPSQLDQPKVDKALAGLDGIVRDAMTSTGVPGIAVAVVHHDRVVYAKGFGVRQVGRPEQVGPDTVFQLASVSKPLASTVIAAVVGRGRVQWTDPVVKHNPTFALNDPYVTSHATFADLMSHRSGLRTGAGDLLEDLGFGRDDILGRLQQEPLDEFRSSYHYSNFGYTAAGVAAAAAMGQSWEDLADELLFRPLNMTSASYRHRDLKAAADRAVLHVRSGTGPWEAKYTRNADAEAPAGGASSSVRDLAQWVRLQLASGSLDGRPIVDPIALQATHVPQVISGPPPAPAGRAHFYGLGWNVSYDAQGRLQLGHSGAFNLGAATAVTLWPGEQLGIAVLTNGQPEGIPEAISAGFLDLAQNGAPTVDWLGFLGGAFRAMLEADKPAVDYSQSPARITPARANSAYVGTYANPYYCPLSVVEDGAGLAMRLGPAGSPTTFRLTHVDGDTFRFESIGENANGLAGAIFAVPGAGAATSVRLDFYDRTGLGTFARG